MFLNIQANDTDNTGVLVIYVQQAAAAKTIGILVKLSTQIAELFLSVDFFKTFWRRNLFFHFIFDCLFFSYK